MYQIISFKIRSKEKKIDPCLISHILSHRNEIVLQPVKSIKHKGFDSYFSITFNLIPNSWKIMANICSAKFGCKLICIYPFCRMPLGLYDAPWSFSDHFLPTRAIYKTRCILRYCLPRVEPKGKIRLLIFVRKNTIAFDFYDDFFLLTFCWKP